MANWGNPENISSYLDVLTELKARDVDAISLLKVAGVDVPNGAIRFVRLTNNKITIQERVAGVWVNKIVSTDSGGFDASGSLGTMASQNSNSVSITGGSVASGTLVGDISAAIIPNLSAGKITSDKFSTDRIPNLAASKINSEQFGVDRIPSLAASKINSEEFGVDRIPDLPASKITSDEFHVDRIPSISKSKISNAGSMIDYNLWKGTASEYAAISNKSDTTVYFVLV